MVNIKIETEQELEELSSELIKILVNLRIATKEWNRVYGFLAKRKKDYWEQKADSLIEIYTKKSVEFSEENYSEISKRKI